MGLVLASALLQGSGLWQGEDEGGFSLWQLRCSARAWADSHLGVKCLYDYTSLSVKKLVSGKSRGLYFPIYKKGKSGIHKWYLPYKTPSDHGAIAIHFPISLFVLGSESFPSPTLCPEEIRIKTLLSASFEVFPNP